MGDFRTGKDEEERGGGKREVGREISALKKTDDCNVFVLVKVSLTRSILIKSSI
ncbi:MAG: hypothetical protein JW984_12125 [Deltaproteobacteria bacterium]|uniref:Uncharacterized protein n=1 Tax=Candidatus Zymogenus saltonus TaxID=2844893 RepID=A0A9D8PR32_9DELT|nr:hypothetical protein [Candidatus Zymogenus saltonus]